MRRLAFILAISISAYCQTINTNVLPSQTGLDLGAPAQQWDAFIRNLNVYGTATFASSINNIYDYCSYSGMHCDGSTDDTSAFNSLLQTVYNNGGGTIVGTPGKTSLISGQITLPNNGAGSNVSQQTIVIRGGGATANGYWAALSSSGFTLDMRYNAPTAKILTYGAGVLEIGNVNLFDGGVDCAPFIFTSGTTLKIHDNSFQGTASGTSACNTGIIFGGTNPLNVGTVNNDAPFQGYGTVVEKNFFSQMKTAALWQNFANGIVFADNTISADCGNSTGAPIVLKRTYVVGHDNGVYGNVIRGNLIEVFNYKYGIDLEDGAATNLLLFNSCYDTGANYTACTYANGNGVTGTNNNVVICGVTAGQPCLTQSTPTVYNTVLDPTYPFLNTNIIHAVDVDTLQTAGNGYVKLGEGTGSLTGYVQWFDPSGTSMGVMGDTTTGTVTLTLQNGATFQITGGNTTIAGTNTIQVGSGVNGYVALVPTAGAGGTGHIDFYDSTATRQGFIGGVSGAVGMNGVFKPSGIERFTIQDIGNCTMSSGTCAAQSLGSTYSAVPRCFGNWTGSGTLTGLLKFPSTTTTVTPASSVGSDTAVVNWICYGN